MNATPKPSSPVGLHRVLTPPGVLPQAAQTLDTSPDPVAGRGQDRRRAAQPRRRLVSAVVEQARRRRRRGPRRGARDRQDPRQDAEPGNGIGRHAGWGCRGGRPDASLPVSVGDRVTTLVSLSLTPLVITDGLQNWDGVERTGALRGIRHPVWPNHRCHRSRRPARRPGDGRYGRGRCARTHWTSGASSTSTRGRPPTVAVIGGAGKSGSLSLAQARASGARKTVGIVPVQHEAELLRDVQAR